ncbi:MAG: DUF2188 domain-containing protein [Burkholderiales bacterium]|jgi:hypothetical protein|nr:DUF2188 domain-containing protein [Burkholderiales bacterium]
MSIPVFLVAPEASIGWRVSFDGAPEAHSFVDKRLAIRYARDWAEANRPSRVVVRSREGSDEAHWDYPPLYLLRRRS